MSRPRLRVAIVGCGLIGDKRAEALGEGDEVVGAFDVSRERTQALASRYGGRACHGFDELLSLDADVVVVATTHDELSPLAERALRSGAHVLVEKPAGLGTAQIDRLAAVAQETGRAVKVGFNHRFHPAIADLAAEVHSGRHGQLMHLRAGYGHGGRIGYDREWRAEPARSGGGELIDQGMHLLDLTHWLAGPLPLHCALLRTHFWDTPVEDNAALLLGAADTRDGVWAMLHVTWTEWKNTFSIEVYCRTAKLVVDGLVRSYGPQRLRVYRMLPELGPPECEERSYGDEDLSWSREWEHFAGALDRGEPLLGDLDDARYAWSRVQDAYAGSPPYAPLGRALTGLFLASLVPDPPPPPICLLAGGLGTRLGDHVRDTPKPLLEVAGEPFLVHQLRLLARHGAQRVVLCVAYRGEQIERRIGTEMFGIRISYSHDGPSRIGTLGAVRRAAEQLGERFLVLYGDTYLRIDYRAAAEAWTRSGLPAMMTVLENRGRWDTSNVSFDGRRVTAYDKRSPDPAMRWIDYGLGGLRAQALGAVGDQVSDLADLYHELADRGSLFGFAATERFYEIGTPESLLETGRFLARRGESDQGPALPVSESPPEWQ